MDKKRPAKLDKIRKEAIERIAKSQQLQIRLAPELWDALYDLSGKRRVPLSSMVREWISERLALETSHGECLQHQLELLAKKIDMACQQERDTQELFITACAYISTVLQKSRASGSPSQSAQSSASSASPGSTPLPTVRELAQAIRAFAQDDRISAEIRRLVVDREDS